MFAEAAEVGSGLRWDPAGLKLFCFFFADSARALRFKVQKGNAMQLPTSDCACTIESLEVRAGRQSELGLGHVRLGRYDDALPFFERAAQLLTDGDSLGKCLHMIGMCHARVGRLDAALRHFSEALRETRKGDEHGRIHPQNIVRSERAQAETRRRLAC